VKGGDRTVGLDHSIALIISGSFRLGYMRREGKEDIRKDPSHLSGHKPWMVHDSFGRTDPSASRPVYC
jgi:hypothetical protein